MKRHRWLIIPVLVAIATQLPLVVLICFYGDVPWEERWTLARLSPNQFLFLLCFFVPAAFLAICAGEDLRKFITEKKLAHDEGAAQSLLWRRLVGPRLIVGLAGIVIGVFGAWADDQVTFAGWYSLEPAAAKQVAKDHQTVLTYLSRYEGEDRARVRKLLVGTMTQAAVEKEGIKLPADPPLEHVQQSVAGLAKAVNTQPSETNQYMRLADFIELAAVVWLVCHIVAWSALLVALRLHAFAESMPKELYRTGSLLIFSVALFVPFIGFRSYATQDVRLVSGQSPADLGGVVIAAFILANLIALYGVFFAKGRILKLIRDGWPMLIGVVTIATVIFAPELASEIFGARASWQTIVILILVYSVFLALWCYLVLRERPSTVRNPQMLS